MFLGEIINRDLHAVGERVVLEIHVGFQAPRNSNKGFLLELVGLLCSLHYNVDLFLFRSESVQGKYDGEAKMHFLFFVLHFGHLGQSFVKVYHWASNSRGLASLWWGK